MDDAERSTIRRNVVRLVVVDSEQRVLLLHIQDFGNPEFGTVWELPGGGIESGETYAQAAARELYEETGLEVQPELVGPPIWHREVTYVYRGARWRQREAIAAIRLPRAQPRIDASHRVAVEQDDVLDARWWTVDEIIGSVERFYPRSLAIHLPGFLRGESIDEPLEVWS